MLAKRFENESAARITRDNENEKRSAKWERMPDSDSDDKQHRRPRRFEDLCWNAPVPPAVASREINAQPAIRDASGAASIQQAANAREDHSNQNREHANVPECAERKIERFEEWNRKWNCDKKATVLRGTAVDWIPDSRNILSIRFPVCRDEEQSCAGEGGDNQQESGRKNSSRVEVSCMCGGVAGEYSEHEACVQHRGITVDVYSAPAKEYRSHF